MAVQYYQGSQIGGSGLWFDPASWSGKTIPLPGQIVVIATPGPDIGPTSYGSFRGGLGNITVDVQPASSFSQPVLTGNNITYGAGFTLNFLDKSGSKTTAPTAVMGANGTTMFRGNRNESPRKHLQKASCTALIRRIVQIGGDNLGKGHRAVTDRFKELVNAGYRWRLERLLPGSIQDEPAA